MFLQATTVTPSGDKFKLEIVKKESAEGAAILRWEREIDTNTDAAVLAELAVVQAEVEEEAQAKTLTDAKFTVEVP